MMIHALPLKTARAARALFGKGNPYLGVGDQLEMIIAGLDVSTFENLTSKSALGPFALLLITVFQICEGLADRRAAEALRMRLDWKYALHLPLDIQGLDISTLCLLRQRLLQDLDALHVLSELIARLRSLNLLPGKEYAPENMSEAVLSICTLTRLETITQAFSAALEALAAEKPDWLRIVALPHWYGQYRQGVNSDEIPLSSDAQEILKISIGTDVDFLLGAISRNGLPETNDLFEIRNLRQVWQDQYEHLEGKLLWREASCASCPLSKNLQHPLQDVPRRTRGGIERLRFS